MSLRLTCYFHPDVLSRVPIIAPGATVAKRPNPIHPPPLFVFYSYRHSAAEEMISLVAVCIAFVPMILAADTSVLQPAVSLRGANPTDQVGGRVRWVLGSVGVGD